MHICPKCGAYDADGSPPFCLADGMPLVNVDPNSDNWRQGSRVIEEKEKAITRQRRKLKWRRISSSLIITLLTIAAAYVLVAKGFIGVERINPPPPVYKISGVVTDGGKRLGGVRITLSGSADAATTTDADGNYALTALAADGSYTITPVAENKATFDPSSRSIDNMTHDESADFTRFVTPEVYKITGRVTDKKGKSLADITLELKGGPKDLSTTIDAAGNYSFEELPADKSYTITPRPSAKITFTPTSHFIPRLMADTPANFTGTVEPDLYKITGRVTDEKGRALPDITVELKTGSRTDDTTTDQRGGYAFNGLADGLSYTITPRRTKKIFFPQGNHVFIPRLTKDTPANFTGRVEPDLYKITGRVTDEKGRALPDITIELKTGSRTDDTTTDQRGGYAFNGLADGLSYTITPRRTKKIFFPQGNHVFIPRLTKDTPANFTGRVEPDLYKITGRVTDEKGRALPDITVELKTGSRTDDTTTDPRGGYAFNGLADGLSYTITPRRTKKISFPRGSHLIPQLMKDESANFTGEVEQDSNLGPDPDCQADRIIVKKMITARLKVQRTGGGSIGLPGVLLPNPQVDVEQTSLGTIEAITFLEKCSIALVTIKYTSHQAAALNRNPVTCRKTEEKWSCDR